MAKLRIKIYQERKKKNTISNISKKYNIKRTATCKLQVTVL